MEETTMDEKKVVESARRMMLEMVMPSVTTALIRTAEKLTVVGGPGAPIMALTSALCTMTAMTATAYMLTDDEVKQTLGEDDQAKQLADILSKGGIGKELVVKLTHEVHKYYHSVQELVAKYAAEKGVPLSEKTETCPFDHAKT